MSQAESQHEEFIGTVLIADDDPDFRSLLVRRAKKMGLAVVEAEDGDQAIRALERQSFDVLVADLYMPGRTGLEVIHAAQRIDQELETIVLTGSATVETAIEALRAGVYDYLTKPLESLTVFEMTLTRTIVRRYLIRENERLFKEIQRLAITDQLTGLFNRRKLMETLEIEVERAQRYSRPLSLIMVDLDDLKGINDSYGHASGDEVIQIVAKAVQDHIRRVDLPTRVGGDEFLILLPEADLEMASLVANRVCNQIFNTPYRSTKISVSVGIGQWRSEFKSVTGFLHAVDQALYQAKRAGGMQIYASNTNGTLQPTRESEESNG